MHYRQFVLSSMAMLVLTACGGSSESNNAPEFSQSSYSITTNEDVSATLNVSATDQNNDVLTFSIANQAGNGIVAIDANSGQLTYTPNENYFGSDNFTLSVSDGEASATVQVSVTVTAVNDAPMFSNNQVFLSGGEIKTGQISATDVDGDTLTFTLNSQPTNGSATLDADGALTFTLTELVNVDDSINVTVSDGNGGTASADLILTTNAASNIDRAYYYYASSASTLAKAETLLSTLNDDVQQDTINTALATGYATAALDSQVEKSLASIVTDVQKAQALIQVAEQYNRQQRFSEANVYAAEAQSIYSQYLAAKGLSNFNNDDAAFYADLATAYENGNNPAAAASVFNVLDLLFSSIFTGEYSTAMLRSFYAFRNLVDDRIELWLAAPTDETRTQLLQLTEKLYSYAKLIPNQVVSNDRNGNLGKPYFATKQGGLQAAVTNFITLNAFDRAKQALADNMAIHGVVGYDATITRTADPYAEVSSTEYPAGIALVADELVTLYPELPVSLILDAIPNATANVIALAESYYTEGKLMAQVRSAATGEDALAAVRATRDEADLRSYFTNLVAFNSVANTPKAAVYRINIGDYAGAKLLLDEAVTVLTSEAYIAENLFMQPFVTGHVGCHFIIQSHLLIAQRDTQNREQHLNDTRSAAQVCVDLAQTYYTVGDDSTDVWISDAVQANSEVVQYLAPLGMQEQIDTIIATAEVNLAKYTSAAIADKAADLKMIGSAFATGSRFASAQPYYDRAIELVEQLEAASEDNLLGRETTRFFDYSASSSRYLSFYQALRAQAGLVENYSQLLETARQNMIALYNSTLNKLDTASLQTQLTYIPQIADDFALLQQYDAALALRANTSLGNVERNSITTQIAQRLSVHDDFPGTTVASVDTDNDGKPNFFAAYATEQDIIASGLTLDEDSDNDGTEDQDDKFPLDASRQ